jgi:D-sedoheptulose 7-phosphate isomerase
MEKISFDDFNRVVELIYGTYVKRRTIFTMGNGGSASTASHFACDINKGVSNGNKNRFRVFCLSDNVPTMLAYANDQSYEDIFVEQLKNMLAVRDVVLGISASGNSKNVIKGIKYANKNKAVSVVFTGYKGGKLAKIADIPIIIPVDDMQKIEDGHLILTHMIMQALNIKIKG